MTRLPRAQSGTERTPRFLGIAPCGNRFFYMRFKLFIDLPVQTLAPQGVRDTRPQ
jgi:hypothetical protein